jgi:hypothetical protein
VECAIEFGSVGMIYTPSSIKIGSGVQKLAQAHRQHGDLISLF